jgi:hypothetical protein
VNLRFEGASTGIVATDNDLPCRSASGRLCQFAARNDMPAGNNVTAEWNWWGTDIANQISALVFDGNDDASRGLIDFDPWRGCGDGICSTGESVCLCPSDCGAHPVTESACNDTTDDDCDGLVDCDDNDCAASCSVCTAAGALCQSDSECCSGRCKVSGGQRRCR